MGIFDGYNQDNTKSADKIRELAKAKTNKLQGLSGSSTTASQYQSLGEGTTTIDEQPYYNFNKIFNKETGSQLQARLGETAAQAVHQEDDGSLYQFGQDDKGNQIKVPYSGAVRRMYGYEQPDGSFKLGLSRGDKDTSDVRYDASQYEKPGPLGVQIGGETPSNKLFDFLLPYDVATETEAVFHGNVPNLEQRKYKISEGGKGTPAYDQYGAGATEYYNSINSILDAKDDFSNESYKKYREDPQYREKLNTKYLPRLTEAQIEDMKDDRWDNIADAVQFSIGSFASRAGDAVIDGGLRLAKELSGVPEEKANSIISKSLNDTVFQGLVDTNGNFTGFDKGKLEKTYGYDSTLVNDKMEELHKAFKEGTFEDKALTFLSTVEVAPELLASSTGDILAAMTGPIGLASIVGGQMNEVLDERSKIKGTTDLSSEDYAIAGASALAYGLLNRITGGNVGLTPGVKNVLFKAASTMDTTSLLKFAKDFGKTGAAIGVKTGGEALEEAAQGLTEVVGQKLATDVENEIISEETGARLFSDAAAGFGASTITATATEVGAKAIDKVKEKQAQKREAEVKKPSKSSKPSKTTSAETKSTLSDINSRRLRQKTKLKDLIDLEDLEISAESTGDTTGLATGKKLKDRIAQEFSERDLTDEDVKLGSKAEAEETIEILLGSGKTSEVLDSNINKIAKANNITPKELKVIKDRYQVEEEATESQIGYKTYGRQLRRLAKNPEIYEKQIDTVVDKLTSFRTSQEEYASTLENAIKDIEAKIESGVAVPGKVKVSELTTPFTIYVRSGKDGAYIDKSAYEILEAKKSNIEGINKELSSVDIESKALDADTKLYINTRTGSDKAKTIAKKDEIRFGRATKLIGTSKAKNSRSSIYMKDNKESTNTGTYTDNDTVAVLLDPVYRNVKEYTDAKKDSNSQESRAFEELIKAKKAGATIITDPYSAKAKGFSARNMVDADIRRQLLRGTRYKEILTKSGKIGSGIWKPADIADKENESLQETIVEEKAQTEDAKAKASALYDILSTKGLKADKYSAQDKNIIARAVKDNTFQAQANRYKRELAKVKDLLDLLDSEEVIDDKDMDYLDEVKKDRKAIYKQAKLELAEELTKEDKIYNFLDNIKTWKEEIAEGDLSHKAELEEAIDGEVIKAILNDSVTKGDTPTKATKTIKAQPIDINSFVSKKIDTTLNSIDYSDMGKKVGKYTAKAIKTFKKTLKPISKAKDLLKSEKLLSYNSPARGLVYDKQGDVNPNVALAMKLALDEYMAFNNNLISREFKTKEDAAALVGRESHQISKEGHDYLRDKGIFLKTIGNELGKNILNKLGLGPVKGVENELYTKMVADLGNMAALSAVESGLLELVREDSSDYAKALDMNMSDAFAIDGSPKIVFIRETAKASKTNSSGISKLSKVRSTYETISDIVGDESTVRKGPRSKAYTLKTSKNKGVRRNEVVDRPDKANEALGNLMAQEYEPNMEAISFIKDNPELIKEYMGYKSEDKISAMSYEYADSARASNREIEKSVSELVKVEDSAMFFDWFYSSNGRYMMDSNTINPQTDKLHRFIITPKAHNVILDPDESTKKGKADMLLFKYALAQAFGYAVDKKSTSSIEQVSVGLMDIGAKKLKKALKKGKLDGKEIIPGVEAEVEHVGHVLQAIQALEAYEASAGKSFSTNLSAEFDAVTSGFGLKLMQMPLVSNSTAWLSKTGIFVNSTVDSMNDKLSEEGFLDSYQTLASEVKGISEGYVRKAYKKTKVLDFGERESKLWKELSKVLPQVQDDGNISGELRTLFKDPFMTFNYAAGMRSIKKSLSGNILGKILNEIANGNPEYNKLAKVLSNYIAIPKGKTLREVIKTRDATRIGAITTTGKESTKVTLDSIMSNLISNSYGNKVEDIMSTNFKEFVNTHTDINNTFKVMFEIFKTEYDKRMKEVDVLDDVAKLKILKDLQNDFPLIRGPLSGKDIDKGIAIFSKKSVTLSADQAKYTPAQTYVNPDVFKQQSIKIRQAIKDFEAARSAGSVIPIHYIDAAIMADTINNKGNVVAIHDAIIPPLTSAIDTVKEYNKSVYTTNRDYSVIKAIRDMLSRIKDPDKLPVDSIELRGYEEETEEKFTVKSGYKFMVDKIADLDNRVDSARKDLFDKDIQIVHMAALPGSSFESNPKVTVPKAEPVKIESPLDYIAEKFSPFINLNEDLPIIEAMIGDKAFSNEQLDRIVEVIMSQKDCK